MADDDFMKALLAGDERAQLRTMVMTLSHQLRSVASLLPDAPYLAAVKRSSIEQAHAAMELLRIHDDRE